MEPGAGFGGLTPDGEVAEHGGQQKAEWVENFLGFKAHYHRGCTRAESQKNSHVNYPVHARESGNARRGSRHLAQGDFERMLTYVLRNAGWRPSRLSSARDMGAGLVFDAKVQTYVSSLPVQVGQRKTPRPASLPAGEDSSRDREERSEQSSNQTQARSR